MWWMQRLLILFLVSAIVNASRVNQDAFEYVLVKIGPTVSTVAFKAINGAGNLYYLLLLKGG
jgi:hypothetical protein